MFKKYKKVISILPVLLLFIAGWTSQTEAKDEQLNIVATQTIFADLVKRIGGEYVTVKAIASPKYNIHFIQPNPGDVRAVTKADLYVDAGLDLEAWSDPLLEAVGRPDLFRNGPHNVDLSKGIRLLEVPDHLSRQEGDQHVFGNPHFQMNPENAKTMTETLLEKLKEIDPDHANTYDENANAFLHQLDQKIREWKELCGHCKGEEIISYHEDIAYFADFLGLKAEQFLEPKPGIPPTPKHLEFLEGYIKDHHVKAIVLPTYYSKSAAETLSKRVGTKVVTICQGVGELPGTDDFFKFFDSNFKLISEVLQ